MNVDIEDRIALVTGASRGIGKRRISTLYFQAAYNKYGECGGV
jgi:NAD(P)-dependent dehydrogenase (short-subunit alcohol dehydrogenase family)